MDLVNQLMGLISGQTQMNESAVTQRDQMGADAAGLRQSGVAKQETAISKEVEARNQLNELQYTQDQMAEQLQTMLNLNPQDAGNAAAQAFAARDQARIAQQTALADQAKLASVDLLSDPVGYIFAQLQLPTVEARISAADQQIKSADYDYAARTGQLEQGKRTMTAQSAELLNKQRRAAADAAAELAAGKLDLVKADVASANAADFMSRLSLRNDIYSTKIKGIEFLMTREERAMDRELRAASLAESQLRNTMAKMQWEDTVNAKNADAEEIARLDQRLAILSNSLGMQDPMTVSILKKMGDSEIRSKWLVAASKMQFGDSLATSIPFFKDSAAATPPAMKDFAAQMERSVAEASQQLQSVMPTAKPAERAAKAFEATQNELISSMSEARTTTPLSSTVWDKKPNPYRAPLVKMSRIVDKDPNLAYLKNNVVRQYVMQLDKEGAIPLGSELTAQQQQDIFAAVQEKIVRGQLAPAKAAADISSFFKEAANYNMALTRYNLFGLPPQSGYVFEIGGSWLSGAVPVKADLFDAAGVENALARNAARLKSREAMKPGNNDLFKAIGDAVSK